MGVMDEASAARIATALAQIGPRLKLLRTQRGMTLTGVSASTGISKSTLSRLETGQRRPTLELLLTLSHAYRVPLDDLVAAPAEGDPRLRLKPGRVKGRTVISFGCAPARRCTVRTTSASTLRRNDLRKQHEHRCCKDELCAACACDDRAAG